MKNSHRTTRPASRPGSDSASPTDDPATLSAAAESPSAKKNAREWETRQPAQVTKQDVETAKRDAKSVPPPGDMGSQMGAVS